VGRCEKTAGVGRSRPRASRVVGEAEAAVRRPEREAQRPREGQRAQVGPQERERRGQLQQEPRRVELEEQGEVQLRAPALARPWERTLRALRVAS
jgi:hypothetical protein